ncbi:hypothetical protein AC1031_018903 [Aphanomyces cochlioides]|nr:hypothetical protein AC1031_018903 [Aphanomyces cochlioides]
MKIFVTGSKGFVGSDVVQELLRAGHQVTGLARSQASADALIKAGANDLDDLDSLRAGAANADAVIYLGFNHDFSKYTENWTADDRAIRTLGESLAGSNRLLIVTSGMHSSSSWTMDAAPATSTIDVSHFSPEQQATLTELLRSIPENIVRGLFSGVNPQDQIMVIESYRLHGEATAQTAAHAAAQRTQEEAAFLYEADLLKAMTRIAGLEESNRNLASQARRPEPPSSGIDDIFIDSSASRDRPLKLEVSKYGGAADEHLFRWVSEVKLAPRPARNERDTARCFRAI